MDKHRIGKLPLALSLCTALLTAGALAGHPDGPGARGEVGPRFEKMAEKLSLSEEQRAAWQALFDSGRDAAAADRKRLQAIHQSLRDLRTDFDQARARALTEELGAIQARQALRRAEHQAAIYQLLEPEQRERWDAAAERRQGREQRGHGPRAHGGRNGADTPPRGAADQ
ncbi:MAG: hypothetical protein CME40_16775 [Haliea sp.]|nr:hypothetical protein [Haliea sp.]|tara:strand:+ start:73607 stop:74116 length:510 start_codon:yes stop_codon:yes gene_type:complete